MKLVTLTLNPAIDVHCHVSSFAPYHENLATVTSRDAGGKGVNISRALHANGVQNIALVVLGRENGADFCASLEAEGLQIRALETEGRIRENITLHTDGAPETRISFKGFSADEALLFRVEDVLSSLIAVGDVVTLTGRLPDGISMEAVKAFLHRLTERGVHTVIDSRSFSLDDLVACRPYLIKPNEEEIALYLGAELSGLGAAADAARRLHAAGIENVMISLGGDGAVLACREGVFAAEAPRIEVLSTVGAGDSSIAGFLAAKERGLHASECLRAAVAFGSAACLCMGTQAPKPADVSSLLDRIQVQAL